jgi:hypothetical protein
MGQSLSESLLDAKKLNKPPDGRAPGTFAALAEGRKEAKNEMNL